MKRLLLVLTTVLALLYTPALEAKGGRSSGRASVATRSARVKTGKTKRVKAPKASKKSKAPGSNDGTYARGSGSSHKGGKYKNSNTGDKYRDRQAGVPK